MKGIRAGHLEFLDGIRGLAAFYVLLGHAYNALFYAGIGSQGGLTRTLMILLKPLAFGRYAVDMFIVLSGYCLMLPVARSSGALRGGFLGYIKRRAIRILPTYYAALIFSVLIIVACGAWVQPASSAMNDFGKLPTSGDLLSHLLLVHNLFPQWSHSINAPMWSVASEWQIYFFFPVLLLPVWRRWNIAATIVIAFIVGYALCLLVPGNLKSAAAPWYIGLFALGMGAATLDFSVPHDLNLIRKTAPWGWICIGVTITLVVTGTLAGGWFRDNAWLIDPIFGLAATSLIIYCAKTLSQTTLNSPPRLLKILCSNYTVGLGSILIQSLSDSLPAD